MHSFLYNSLGIVLKCDTAIAVHVCITLYKIFVLNGFPAAFFSTTARFICQNKYLKSVNVCLKSKEIAEMQTPINLSMK